MTLDEAKSEVLERIDAHPKEKSAQEVISDLDLKSLATKVAVRQSRHRALTLSSLLDTAKVRLYEQMEPPVQEAPIKSRKAGPLPILLPEDTDAVQYIFWIDRWTHFRKVTSTGQPYFTGAPAVRLYQEAENVQLGFMIESFNGTPTFRHHSEKLGEEAARTYIRQTREPGEEEPGEEEPGEESESTRPGVGVLCDGWERLLGQTDGFEGK